MATRRAIKAAWSSMASQSPAWTRRREPLRPIHSPQAAAARTPSRSARLNATRHSAGRGALVDDNDEVEASGHATAAREHVYGFNRATMWERDQIPAETSDELAEFADLAAALPQAFSQLSSTLERALADQVLSMDAMTDESDPAMSIGVARLHLEEARGLAVDLHKHLNAARNATSHIISQGVDDGQESMPWDQP